MAIRGLIRLPALFLFVTYSFVGFIYFVPGSLIAISIACAAHFFRSANKAGGRRWSGLWTAAGGVFWLSLIPASLWLVGDAYGWSFLLRKLPLDALGVGVWWLGWLGVRRLGLRFRGEAGG